MQQATPGSPADTVQDATSLAHRHVARLRLVSARMVLLQRAGKVAVHHACIGEEGAIVGAALGARERDWVFGGPREWGLALVRGAALADYVHQAFGTRASRTKGHAPPDAFASRPVRVAPPSAIGGAHLPQAVGCAWAARMRKDDVATVAIFGVEATSTGDFHNAMNFAGVFKAPCVFVCRIPVGAASVDVADRAAAYGVASARIDAADAALVEKTVRAAIERAAGGAGPTLVEAVTRPIGALEDAALEGDAAAAAGGDGLAIDDAFVREVRAELDAAIAAAEAAGPPDRSTLFEGVYATRPPTKERDPWRR